jgi:ABC-type transport system involved in multi-copper enzyme maturation permease subunit
VSTATLPAPTSTRQPVSTSAERVTQGRVVRSEWIKFRSLRSSWFTMFASIVGMIGIGLLISYVTQQHWARMDPQERLGFDPTGRSLGGVFLAQLAVGVLGVLFISGEYATGMIRATLSAVPRRLPVLWAKLAVYGAVTFITMIVSAFLAFLGGQALLGSHGTSLSAPHVTRAVVGVALYLTVVGLLAVGLGFIVRSTAGGIATLFGLLLVLPALAHALPSNWQSAVSPYLPSNAGGAVFAVRPDPGTLSTWVGFAVFCGYAVAAIVVGAVLLMRRDA